MVWGQGFNQQTEEIDKAGYNQAARITEILSMLRNTYISSMIEGDLSSALKICRRVLDIISARIEPTEITKTNNIIFKINSHLPEATKTYIHNQMKYYSNIKVRQALEKDIENLWRTLEQLQDKYGYGMFSEEESGL